MIDSARVPEVEFGETLARYVLSSNHVRRSDLTVKPDAFMPPPNKELSVTRHTMATESELWAVGESVAMARGKTLYGRGDIPVSECMRQNLSVEAAPIDGNTNHAHVLGWPDDKPLQKAIAQELAASAMLRSRVDFG